MAVFSSSERSKRLLRGAWLVLLILTLSFYALRQLYNGPYGNDFTIFLTGARVILEGKGAELYDLSVQTEVQSGLVETEFTGGLLPFNYPPYVAAIFLPLALVPPDVAYYVWVLALWCLLLGLLASMNRQLVLWGFTLPVPLFVLLLGFAPVIEALLMGQMSLVLVALWLWAFVSWRHRRWGQLGVALALSAFKPQMALLLVVALATQKQWRALGYALGTQILLWAAAILLLGPETLGSYVEMLRTSASTIGTLGFYPDAMPNLRGLVTIIGVAPELSIWVAMVGWLASVGLVWLVWRGPSSLPVNFGFTALLAVLFSPHLYIHDASLLLLAVICAQLGYAEAGLKLDAWWIFAPYATLFLGMYSLVFRLLPYTGAIVAVWLLGGILVLLFSAISRKQKAISDQQLATNRAVRPNVSGGEPLNARIEG